MKADERLLRPIEVRNALNISRSTMIKLEALGVLKPANVPGLKHRRYREDDVRKIYGEK
jgi:DNA-binding transcriptional MerR regulator